MKKPAIRFCVEAETAWPFNQALYKMHHHYFATERRAKRWAKAFVRRHPYGEAKIFKTATHFKWTRRYETS